MKEKTLKDVHAGIREFYNRAVEFERKENWEYAISCMLEAVLRVPAFTEARQKLRHYEKQLTKKIKGSPSLMQQIKTFISMGKIKKLTKTSPMEAVGECEKLLTKQLGRKVKIVNGKRKGRFELEFYGQDDLQDRKSVV